MRQIMAAIVVGIMLPGCAGAPQPPPSVPVKGRVMQQGKPLPGVVLTFWPQEERLQTLIKPPSGTSESDGTFQIACPKGPYRVTAVVPPRLGSVPALESGLPGPPAKTSTPPLTSIPELYWRPADTPLRVDISVTGADNLVLTIAPPTKSP